MHADISYRTTYRYSDKVSESQNQVRACPVTDTHQQLVSYRIETRPQARVLHHTDAWGTRVDSFGVRRAHDHLVVSIHAEVQTNPRNEPAGGVPLGGVSEPAFVDAHWEYLGPTRHTMVTAQVADIARGCVVDSGDDVVTASGCMAAWVNTSLTYAPGETDIGVTTAEVLRRRTGVCQDFSHLLIALCRSAGIPARYVSGYFFAASETNPADDDGVHTVQVQTHAWVEVAIPGFGWWALDPTNLSPVGERHITIGRARDYDDVPPFRGVYTGEADAEVLAHVTIRRLDADHQPAYTSDEVLQAFPAGKPAARRQPQMQSQ